MGDALQAQDAIFRGQARAQEAWNKFLAKWSEPMMTKNLKVMWALMPPAQKEALKTANPKKYEEISKFFEQS